MIFIENLMIFIFLFLFPAYLPTLFHHLGRPSNNKSNWNGLIMVPIITGCDGLTVDPIKLKIKVTNKVETWGKNMKQASSVKVRVHISYFQFSLS